MPELGKYALEVLLAYGVSLTLLSAVTIWSFAQAGRAARQLAQIEIRKAQQ